VVVDEVTFVVVVGLELVVVVDGAVVQAIVETASEPV